MDELNLSLTPSSLHALSFLFDSPNAVANAPSFLLLTEYSPYRESVVLPVMPHASLIRSEIVNATGRFSVTVGTTRDDSKVALSQFPPLFGDPDPSLLITERKAPDASLYPSSTPIWPEMPHLILSIQDTDCVNGEISFITGTRYDASNVSMCGASSPGA